MGHCRRRPGRCCCRDGCWRSSSFVKNCGGTTNAYTQGYDAGATSASTATADAAAANANAAAANANAAAANANIAAVNASGTYTVAPAGANVTYVMGGIYGALPAGCITPNVGGKATTCAETPGSVRLMVRVACITQMFLLHLHDGGIHSLHQYNFRAQEVREEYREEHR